MRVALYAGAFKENQDGANRSLYQLVRSLQANGMQVGVWSYDRTPSPVASWVTHFTVPSLPPHLGTADIARQDAVSRPGLCFEAQLASGQPSGNP